MAYSVGIPLTYTVELSPRRGLAMGFLGFQPRTYLIQVFTKLSTLSGTLSPTA